MVEKEENRIVIRVKKHTVGILRSKAETQRNKPVLLSSHNSNERRKINLEEKNFLSPAPKIPPHNHLKMYLGEQNGEELPRSSPQTRKSTTKKFSNSDKKIIPPDTNIVPCENKPNVFINYSTSVQKYKKSSSNNNSQNNSANTSNPSKKPETPKTQMKKIFIKEKEIEEAEKKHIRSNSREIEKLELTKMKKSIQFTTTIKQNLSSKEKIVNFNLNDEKQVIKLPPNIPKEAKTIGLKKGLFLSKENQKTSTILSQLLKNGNNNSSTKGDTISSVSKVKLSTSGSAYSVNILNFNSGRLVETAEKKY